MLKKFLKLWNGEESLLHAFWLYGMAVVAQPIFLLVLFPDALLIIFKFHLGAVTYPIIVLDIYLAWLCVVIFRCAGNASHLWQGMARICVIAGAVYMASFSYKLYKDFQYYTHALTIVKDLVEERYGPNERDKEFLKAHPHPVSFALIQGMLNDNEQGARRAMRVLTEIATERTIPYLESIMKGNWRYDRNERLRAKWVLVYMHTENDKSAYETYDIPEED